MSESKGQEYTERQENDFLRREIVGLTVTDAQYCDTHGFMFEFDHRFRLMFRAEAQWAKRKAD